MKISNSVRSELLQNAADIAEQQKLAAIRDAEQSVLPTHDSLLRRGLALGKIVTKTEQKKLSADPLRMPVLVMSKIAELPVFDEGDYNIHVRLGYRTPIRVNKVEMGSDETQVQYRAYDPSTKATTRFYDIAQFHRNGFVRYADPAIENRHLVDLNTGDERLLAVAKLLDVLEVAEFNLPE